PLPLFARFCIPFLVLFTCFSRPFLRPFRVRFASGLVQNGTDVSKQTVFFARLFQILITRDCQNRVSGGTMNREARPGRTTGLAGPALVAPVPSGLNDQPRPRDAVGSGLNDQPRPRRW